MKDEKMKIEQRLQNMKKTYMKINEMIDSLPEIIPSEFRDTIKKTIIGDKELKTLMEGVDSHRPPRLFLIGRTGVGKSSLINAICGSYLAPVSDTRSCTETAQIYKCMEGDRVLMDILDTRGIAESEELVEGISAEQMLIDQINAFSPDAAIFMLNCTHRDDVDEDVHFLKKVAKEYGDRNKVRLPIVVVVNKADEMAPSRYKVPKEYPKKKIENINEVVRYYKEIIIKNGLKIDDIVAVSSLLEWQTPDGMDVDPEMIENLPENDVNNLVISFDGRYQIEELTEILIKAILDVEAQMGLRMAARLDQVVKRFASHLIKLFSSFAMTVAASPIPVSDIYVLLVLQSLLVSLIASLSGRDISLDTAKEFILSLGGVAGLGYSFKLLAQQSAKLLNLVVPGSGSAVSSGVAFFGTMAIGESAVNYYIDGKTIEEAKKVLDAIHKKSEEETEPVDES